MFSACTLYASHLSAMRSLCSSLSPSAMGKSSKSLSSSSTAPSLYRVRKPSRPIARMCVMSGGTQSSGISSSVPLYSFAVAVSPRILSLSSSNRSNSTPWALAMPLAVILSRHVV